MWFLKIFSNKTIALLFLTRTHKNKYFQFINGKQESNELVIVENKKNPSGYSKNKCMFKAHSIHTDIKKYRENLMRKNEPVNNSKFGVLNYIANNTITFISNNSQNKFFFMFLLSQKWTWKNICLFFLKHHPWRCYKG